MEVGGFLHLHSVHNDYYFTTLRIIVNSPSSLQKTCMHVGTKFYEDVHTCSSLLKLPLWGKQSSFISCKWACSWKEKTYSTEWNLMNKSHERRKTSFNNSFPIIWEPNMAHAVSTWYFFPCLQYNPAAGSICFVLRTMKDCITI